MLREAFELDSRLLRTLWSLVAKPGRLTREFTQGRRASYMSPVRLYLITSLVFFFFLSISAEWDLTLEGDVPQEELAEAWEEFRTGPDFPTVYGLMDEAEKARIHKRFQLSDEVIEGLAKSDVAVDADRESWELQVARRAMTLEPTQIRDNLLDGMPIAMFFLLPIYALLMKLLYPGRYYTEHLVLSFHLHSFLFLLFTLLSFVPEPPVGSLDVVWSGLRGLLQMGALVYIFLTMKVVYGQSLAMTTLKFVLQFVAYSVLLGGAISLAFLITLFL